MRKSQKRLRRGRKTRRLEVQQMESRCMLSAACWVAPGLDVNDDGLVTPGDALIVINDVNAKGAHPESIFGDAPYTDVNGDGISSANDALAVISVLNQHGAALLVQIVEWECGETEVVVNDPPQSEVETATDVVFAEIETWGNRAADDLYLTLRGSGEGIEGRNLHQVRDLTLTNEEFSIEGQWTFAGQDERGPFTTYKFPDAIAESVRGETFEVHGWIAGYVSAGTQIWVENTNAYAIPQGWQYASSPITVVDSGISLESVGPNYAQPLVEGIQTMATWELTTTTIDVPTTGLIVTAYVDNAVVSGNISLYNQANLENPINPSYVVTMEGDNITGDHFDEPVVMLFDLPVEDFTASQDNPLTFQLDFRVFSAKVDPQSESWIQVGIDNVDNANAFAPMRGHFRWLKDGVERTGLPVGASGVWASPFEN